MRWSDKSDAAIKSRFVVLAATSVAAWILIGVSLGFADATPASASEESGDLPMHTRWGDADCDGIMESTDALALLVYIAGMPPAPQDEPCSDIGSPHQIGFSYGDVNCSGAVDATDALRLLIYVAALPPLPVPAGCPPIGASLGDQ